MDIYANKIITRAILPSSFNYEDLYRLAEATVKLHDKCARVFESEIKEKKFYVPSEALNNQSNEEIKKYIRDYYKLTYEIVGTNGEYLNFNEIDHIQISDLPYKILRIKISNSGFHKTILGSLPSTCIEIVLDFSHVNVFDLPSSSYITSNNSSSFNIQSCDSTFATGIAETIESFFSKYKNIFPIIHYRFVCDIVIYFVYLPMVYLVINSIDEEFKNNINLLGIFENIFLASVLIIFLMASFRIVFNLGRRLYPYMELREQNSKLISWFRAVYSIFTITILTSVFYEGVVSFITKVFKF